MARHLGRGLEHITLEPEEYAIDLEIADRYQSFSEELLRLSLLGLAGFGYLFGTAPGGPVRLSDVTFGSPLATAGLVAFGVAAAAALAHRFYSTDCLTHQVRRIRLGKVLNKLDVDASFVPPLDRATLEAKRDEERLSFEKDLRHCRWTLLVACAGLVGGALAIAGAFVALIA